MSSSVPCGCLGWGFFWKAGLGFTPVAGVGFGAGFPFTGLPLGNTCGPWLLLLAACGPWLLLLAAGGPWSYLPPNSAQYLSIAGSYGGPRLLLLAGWLGSGAALLFAFGFAFGFPFGGFGFAFGFVWANDIETSGRSRGMCLQHFACQSCRLSCESHRLYTSLH